MSDAPSLPSMAQDSDRGKDLVMVLTILTTVFAAVLAALQADAAIRASSANRESQYLAIAASGELQRIGLAGNYEMAVFGDSLKDLQEATILELTAMEQQDRGEDTLATTTLAESAAAQARGQTGRLFSIFYTDPRYAPASADELPRIDSYLADTQAAAVDLVAKQNAAADQYHRWNDKADAYVTVLAALAVAFFLFGLGQTVRLARLRMLFAASGGLILLLSSAWTVAILIR